MLYYIDKDRKNYGKGFSLQTPSIAGLAVHTSFFWSITFFFNIAMMPMILHEFCGVQIVAVVL